MFWWCILYFKWQCTHNGDESPWGLNIYSFKIALKKFLYTYPFYTMEEYLSQSWIMYCITRFLLQWYIHLRFCLLALCKYSWIVFKFLFGYTMNVFIDCIFWTDHISLYKFDLSYLHIIITNYYDMYFMTIIIQ